MLLFLFCGKFLFLSWLGPLPLPLAFKVRSQKFRSLAVENESQVCVVLLAFVRWILDEPLDKAHFQELGMQFLMQQRLKGMRKEKEPFRSVVLFGR